MAHLHVGAAGMNRIREVREAAGLTQEGLAFKAGVALRTMQRADRGHDPSMAVLRKIATALGVTPSELLEDDVA